MTVDLTNVDIRGAYSKHLNLGRKKANTHGGEFCTSCPWCGTGNDRFCVWPYRLEAEGNPTTHWCRVCKESGDVISFIEYAENLSFPEACRALNIELNGVAPSTPQHTWKQADEDEAPSAEWIKSAIEFATQCKEALWSEVGKNALAWLRKRGLSDATIRRAGLGYNPITRFDEKDIWGISNRTDIKKVWLPRGITIPWVVERNIWKISIRRPDPDLERDLAKGVSRPAKYIAVAGGSNGIYGIDAFNCERPTVILEGEFDKLILSQAIGSKANVLATGSTAKGRGEKWALTIAQSPIILVGFDADEGGNKAMNEYWLHYLPQSLPWQPWSKDVNDMFLAGHDLDEWLRMGIEIAKPTPTLEDAPVTEPISVVNEPVPDPVGEPALTDGYSKCYSCQKPFPDFEGWEFESIPDHDLMNYDSDGQLYCRECRPALFGETPIAEQEQCSQGMGATYEQFQSHVQALAEALSDGCTVTYQPRGYTIQQRAAELEAEARQARREQEARIRAAQYNRIFKHSPILEEAV